MTMKSLKLKILLPVVVIVIVGMLVVSVSSYFISRNVVVADVEEITSGKAQKIESFIDGKLEKWKTQLEILAATDIVKNLDYVQFKQYIASRNDIFKEYEMFLIADKTGAYKATAGSDGNISDREYFPRVMSGEFTISEPVMSKATGKPIIVIAAPVKNSNNDVIGIVAGTMELTGLSEMVSSEKFGKTGYAYMVAKDGLLIAHPDKSKIFKENIITGDNQSLAETAKKAINGEDGVGYYTYNGVERISAYQHLKTAGWGIIASISYDESTQDIRNIRNNAALIGFLVILLIVAVVFLIINITIRPVIKMAELTKEIAKGDLTVTVVAKGKDEISILSGNFNEMIQKMRKLILDMRDTGVTVASSSEEMMASTEEARKASEQVAEAIMDLAKGATEQAIATEKGNAGIKEIAEGLSKIAEDMEHSSKLVENAKAVLETGEKSVKFQEIKVNENTQVSREVAEAITELSDKSKEIDQILDVIRNISEQTNLLALNAAIEAARAGEAGKGFAVVADEIRKLAEQTGSSVKQIGRIIKQVQNGVEHSVSQMNNAKAVVYEQVDALSQTKNAFIDISSVVTTIARNVEIASAAANVLSEEAIKASYAISDIASISQETAAGSEEVSASTEEQTSVIHQIADSAEHLAELAANLHISIGRFKV